MKTLFRIFCVLVLLTVAACDLMREKNDPVVVSVGDSKLYLSDIKKQAPEWESWTDRERLAFLERWIDEETMFQEAQLKGVDSDPILSMQIEQTVRKMVVDRFLQGFEDTMVVSDAERIDYYNAHSLSEMDGGTYNSPRSDIQPNVSSRTNTANQLLAEKLVVTAPVPKGDLTFGEEASAVDRTSDFTQSGFSADNSVHQKTTIWSLFANYGLRFGKFSLNTGLRWQNEHIRYDQNGQRNDEMSPDYHVLIPRASLTYKTDKWTHTLAYNCTRRNPPYLRLTTAVNYRSRYEYDTGNPYLQPQTSHIISWTSRWKWLYAELYYEYAKNVITSFQSAYDDVNHPGVIIDDYRNIPWWHDYGLTLNCSPKIGIWQLNYTASLEYKDEDLEPLGITHNFKGICTEFNLDNTFTLPKAWLLNIQGYIEPYYRSGFHIFKTSGSLNLRLSRQFLKDKSLSVALLARDILRTDYVKGTEYNGIGYRVDVETYHDRRRFGIDISWKFNATRSRYKGSHAGQDERNRL